VRDEPREVVLAVESRDAGYLVLSDLDYPGWTARVDGRPAAILPANAAGRAVEVPPGRHRVELRFEPASLRYGIVVSAVAALLVAVLSWWRRLWGA
jgi:uncharacterized membrane protein YfhO